MLLNDKQINEFGEKHIGHFSKEKVFNIGYDLQTEAFCVEQGDERKEIVLAPSDSVFVKSLEAIELPDNMAAYVALRNSRIRQGLTLDAPIYQPGHSTKVFYRITNVSHNEIRLDTKQGIASIFFIRLNNDVLKPYVGTFQDEIDYKGMGKYTSMIGKDIHSIDEKLESVKKVENTIYTNVLSILAIFVGIFSLINVNLTSVLNQVTIKTLLTLNLTTMGSIGFMIALINTVLPNGKHKGAAWLACVFAFFAAFIVQFALQ